MSLINYKQLGFRAALLKKIARVSQRSIAAPFRNSLVDHKFWLRFGTSDLEIYDQIFNKMEYDFDLKNPPKFIVDAGANVGLSTIFFASKYKDAKIIAIEPEKSNFFQLRRNTASYRNVHCIHAALWSENSTLNVYDQGVGHWGIQALATPPDPTTAVIGQVSTVTIESILRDFSVNYVDVLKVDIEGAERELLEKATNWIDRIGVMVIELHERYVPGCEQAFAEIAKTFAIRTTLGENQVLARHGLL